MNVRICILFGKSEKALQGTERADRKEESEAVKTSILEFKLGKKAMKVSRLRSALFEDL